MYYVVPQGHSILRSIGKLETLYAARKSAEAAKAQTGNNYEIILMERVYTTQTIDEALLADIAAK